MLPKLVATLGPASLDKDKIQTMDNIGADCFRINLSHSNHNTISEALSICNSAGVNPCLDTQGAQLRVSGNGTLYKMGESVTLIDSSNINTSLSPSQISSSISINHWDELLNSLREGSHLRIDTSGLVLCINDIQANSIRAEVTSQGTAGLNRAADLIDTTIKLSPLTSFDIEAIKMPLTKKSKIIYLSFTNSASDVELVKSMLPNETNIVAKIESKQGIINLSEICDIADAILIDRGDLSREIGISNVPLAVNSILKSASQKTTPVYIATNILDSMMTSSLPSRAEISDIYNQLCLGAHGLVLAAETAIGSNPVQSVAVLKHMLDKYKYSKQGISSFIAQSNQFLAPYPELSYWL